MKTIGIILIGFGFILNAIILILKYYRIIPKWSNEGLLPYLYFIGLLTIFAGISIGLFYFF